MSRKVLKNKDYELAYGMDHVMGIYVQVFDRNVVKDENGGVLVDMDQFSHPDLTIDRVINVAADYGFDISKEV